MIRNSNNILVVGYVQVMIRSNNIQVVRSIQVMIRSNDILVVGYTGHD